MMEIESNQPKVIRPSNLSLYQLKCYYELFFMNFGLGNQAPLQGFLKTTDCPMCKGKNIKIDLDEIHFSLECDHPALLNERMECGLSWWMGEQGDSTYGEMYKAMLQPTNEYLGDFLDGLTRMRDHYREALDLEPTYKF